MTNNYIKNGKIVAVGGTISENGITYSGVTEEWLLANGWEETKPVTEEELPMDLKIKRLKNTVIAKIDRVDNSNFVNAFELNGEEIWLNKADRVGLVNAVNSAKALGMDNVNLGLGNNTYNVPCDMALQMLYALEMYALECYNVTLAHKNAVNKLETIEELNAFDIYGGYPMKLVFNIPNTEE